MTLPESQARPAEALAGPGLLTADFASCSILTHTPKKGSLGATAPIFAGLRSESCQIWPTSVVASSTVIEPQPGARRSRARTGKPLPGKGFRAVAVGFEPTVVLPTHAFEACSFGRSDTPPSTRIQELAGSNFTGERRRTPRAAPRTRLPVRPRPRLDGG